MFKEKFKKMGPPRFPGGLTTALGTGLDGVAAAAGGVAAAGEGKAFIEGMKLLTAQSNEFQLELAQMEFRKKVMEGFAKFLKDMGKAFTQVGQ